MSLSGSSDSRCRRSEEHTSELQSRLHLVCRLLLEKTRAYAKAAELLALPVHLERLAGQPALAAGDAERALEPREAASRGFAPLHFEFFFNGTAPPRSPLLSPPDTSQ